MLGFGLGLRSPHYDQVLNQQPTEVDWFEAVSYTHLRAHET